MVKFIAFDLDGTLVDSVPDLTVAVDKAMRSMGRDGVSEEKVREWVGNGADNLVARALSQSYHIDPSISDELKLQARAEFDHFYAECDHDQSHLYPTVKNTLEQLFAEGYQLAIVTNKPGQFVPDILEQHQIAHLFVEVVGGDALPKRKPDPMPLEYLMDKYGMARNQMILVGDSKNDVLAAKNAGIGSVALPYGYNHGEPIEDSNPDFLIQQLSGLHEVLHQLSQ
ncbi:phosphoglycolate phosphatase [Vibrio ishigakensis]|uniref:Phosphoglycolate phosphatase n=1 Tax=Vibrio ishigakensis TaxID=1481914 RepID=A0A0B8PM41_9VIBR|nr:phosphoglycolate phosphatase [Vibrio ishigakensis]